MVRLILFDIERINVGDLLSALVKVCPQLRTEDLDAALDNLRRMGFELLLAPIPMPEDDESLEVLEGSDVEVDPRRRAKIPRDVLAVLVKYCRAPRYPFKVLETHVFDGFRIVLGESFDFDSIAVLETNVDDASGEILANALEKLGEICLDVSAVQCIGKKGRPAVIVRALCRFEDVERVAKVMMEETGSLGVRVIPVSRVVEFRRIEERDVEVFGRRFRVRVKFSSSSIVKPEFEDVKRIAEELGIPLLAVYKEVLRSC